MEKLERRIEGAEKALETLREILREPYSVIVRDAAIQRFEYYYELMDTVFNLTKKKFEENS